jgi:hypothetical protein
MCYQQTFHLGIGKYALTQSGLFYTNDIAVMVEVCVRMLIDIEARTYIALTLALLRCLFQLLLAQQSESQGQETELLGDCSVASNAQQSDGYNEHLRSDHHDHQPNHHHHLHKHHTSHPHRKPANTSDASLRAVSRIVGTLQEMVGEEDSEKASVTLPACSWSHSRTIPVERGGESVGEWQWTTLTEVALVCTKIRKLLGVED